MGRSAMEIPKERTRFHRSDRPRDSVPIGLFAQSGNVSCNMPSPRGPIDDYVVEDHADHILATFKTQREAIEWAKKNVYYFAVVDLTLALGLYQPIAALSATPTAL